MTTPNYDIPDEFLALVEKGTNGQLRLGQFLYNFNYWVSQKKQLDPFYVNNDTLCALLKEYTDGQKFIKP